MAPGASLEGVESEAPVDFALLQLVRDYRGGVSLSLLTSIRILSTGRASSQVIGFPTAF